MSTLADRVLSRLEESTTYSEPVRNTLDRLEAFCKRSTGRLNHWKIGNKVFFFEWPEHGEVEEVSGSVYEQIGSTSVHVGEYILDEAGNVVEFPFLPKEVQDQVSRGE